MNPVQPIAVAQYGIGPIGAEIARLLLTKPWLRVVAAVDVDPNKIGKDVGDVDRTALEHRPLDHAASSRLEWNAAGELLPVRRVFAGAAKTFIVSSSGGSNAHPETADPCGSASGSRRR